MEKNKKRKIKVLNSDNGGEYTSDLFLQLCPDEGIKRHFTVREIPQQNVVVDRMNKTCWRRFVACYPTLNYQNLFGLRH